MILDQENVPHLKPWLVRTLEPMYARILSGSPWKLIQTIGRCDAEPGALADYVLALLKHNGPENELRKEMESQLEEFLEKGAIPSSTQKTGTDDNLQSVNHSSIHYLLLYGLNHIYLIPRLLLLLPPHFLKKRHLTLAFPYH